MEQVLMPENVPKPKNNKVSSLTEEKRKIGKKLILMYLLR